MKTNHSLAIGLAAILLAACEGSPTTPPLSAEAPLATTAVAFQFTEGGSAGVLSIAADGSAVYRDEYCDGRENTMGTVVGTAITFERMTYPACGETTPLWADISVEGLNRETGCFARLSFVWGYDFIRNYEAYPIDDRCRSSSN